MGALIILGLKGRHNGHCVGPSGLETLLFSYSGGSRHRQRMCRASCPNKMHNFKTRKRVRLIVTRSLACASGFYWRLVSAVQLAPAGAFWQPFVVQDRLAEATGKRLSSLPGLGAVPLSQSDNSAAQLALPNGSHVAQKAIKRSGV